MKRKYTTEERRSIILNTLRDEGRVSVASLVDTFEVSEVSIRKDLAVLEEKQLLVRVKGGAINLHQSGEYDDNSIIEKQKLHSREKQILGKFAASLVNENETIIIDSGTTTMEIAKNLGHLKKITVITNALDIAITLNHYDKFSVILLGGHMRGLSYSTVGMIAEYSMKNFYCDKLFLGVDSFNMKDGLSTPNIEEASLNQAMIAAAKEVIAVFDSSKFGKRGFVHISKLDKIDMIVTDSNISNEYRQIIESAGIKLHIVQLE